MTILLHILVIVAFSAYLGGAIGGGMLVARLGGSRLRVATKFCSIVAVVALSLVLLILLGGETGQFEGAAVYYVMVLLLVELGYRWVGLGSSLVRLWVSVVGLGVLGAMSMLSHLSPIPIAPSTGSLPVAFWVLHLVSAVLAEGCLALTAIVGGAAAAADRRIRSMKLSIGGDQGPSLVLLERVYGGLILGGFIAMTMSVGTGGVWSLVSHAHVPQDVTLYFALISWATLGMLVHLRFGLSWSLIRIAWVLSVVVPLLFASYVTMALYRGELFHQQLRRERASSEYGGVTFVYDGTVNSKPWT